MNDATTKIVMHGKKHWGSYVISTLTSVAAAVGAWAVIATQLDTSIVTEQELMEHDETVHSGSEDKIDRLYERNLRDELNRYLWIRCQNPTLAPDISNRIVELRREYFEETGEMYTRSCEELRIILGHPEGDD